MIRSGTIRRLVADIPGGLSLTPTHKFRRMLSQLAKGIKGSYSGSDAYLYIASRHLLWLTPPPTTIKTSPLEV
jgi:hypothetical protein